MDALGRGTAQIITADTGPSLPLLHTEEGNEYPIYTGPLGTARLFIRRDRYLTERVQHGKCWAFLTAEPEQDVREWGVDYHSPETALRQALGVYFHVNGYDDASLRVALRRVIEAELNQLQEQP